MLLKKKQYGRSIGFRAISQIVKRERMTDVTIVETGTLRCDRAEYALGDGWSTLFFRGLIERHGGVFFTVDIDLNHIEISKAVITRDFGDLRNTVHCCQDSVTVLRDF